MTMSAQEFYDRTVKAAFDGTFPGWDPVNKTCEYRIGAHRCLVGNIIPEKLITPKCADELLAELFRIQWKGCIPEGVTVAGMGKLQLLHDTWAQKDDCWDGKGFVTAFNNHFFCPQGVVKATPEEAERRYK